MVYLVLGLVIFIATHGISIVMAEKRAAIIERHGRFMWLVPYSILSLVGLIIIVIGYGQARDETVLLYQLPPWVNHLSSLLMVFAMIFFVAAYLSGNLAKKLKHPQLVAIKTWALAHLLSNGDTASIILFGSFLAWAVAARISLKKRVAAGLARDNKGGPASRDVAAIIVGLALYAIIAFWAHLHFFGVSPIATS